MTGSEAGNANDPRNPNDPNDAVGTGTSQVPTHTAAAAAPATSEATGEADAISERHDDPTASTAYDPGDTQPQEPAATGDTRRGFDMSALPDLRDPASRGGADDSPEPAGRPGVARGSDDGYSDAEHQSRAEFTTVYDILDSLERQLDEAKSSIFTPSQVRIDRNEFAAQLDELKDMLPVQLERASALMREAERRLENAQTQANAVIASAQSQAAGIIHDAQEQAQFLAGQDNITTIARQKARAILDQAQTKADKLTSGANQYCTDVMQGLQDQLDKLSQDVRGGLTVLDQREREASERLDHIQPDDYPEA